MSLPYEKLTPILGETATEYTPENETTPEFMNGKFEELLANDKNLDNKINDCLQYRGVITSISQIDKDGYYYVNLGDSTFPYPYGILKIVSGYGEKVATYDTTGNDKKTYKNVKTSGANWGVWQPIATITKTPVTLTANTGYSVLSQDNYVINNVAYYSCIISKTDGSVFGTNTVLSVATMPPNARPVKQSFGNFCGLVGASNIGVGTCVLYPDGTVYGSTISSNVSQFRMSWTVII